MQSATCWTSNRMWLETKTVLPSAPRRRISSRTSTIPAGPSRFAGSSRRSSSGSFSSAAPMPGRCFHPEGVRLHLVTRALRKSYLVEHLADAKAADPRYPREELEVPAAGEARVQHGRLDYRAHAADDAGESTRGVDAEEPARPLVAPTSPSRHRMVVVLPAPFGPRNPNTPPSEPQGRDRPGRPSARRGQRRYSLRKAETSSTRSA